MPFEENGIITRFDCPTSEEDPLLKEAIGVSAEQSGGVTALL
jgi:hypothetical protein